MDIEGSEYDIIDEICREGIVVKQMLIEIHHHFDSIPVSLTKAAVNKLNSHGYKVFNISPDGHEVSFIMVETMMLQFTLYLSHQLILQAYY